MNRIQFFVLTGLSSLIVLLLIGDIFLSRENNFEQNRLAAAQQVINQGQNFQNNLKQLAIRIYQDSQKSNDPGLKDLLARQQISYNAGGANGSEPMQNSTSGPAQSPAPAVAH